jgi:hypothetical protein
MNGYLYNIWKSCFNRLENYIAGIGFRFQLIKDQVEDSGE